MNLYDKNGNQIQYAADCEGKTLLMFGDSLVEACGGTSFYPSSHAGWWTGLYYGSKTALRLGFGAIDNRGYGGSNIYYNDGAYGLENCGVAKLHTWLGEVEEHTVNPNNCVCTVTFGTNQVDSRIGTINDTMSETYTENVTQYSAMKYFITKLREVQVDYPCFSFGFVLPPYQDATGIGSNRNVSLSRAALLNILTTDEWMAPYVDMWTESGLNPDILPDGVHMSNEQSQNLYFKAYCEFVRKLGL